MEQQLEKRCPACGGTLECKLSQFAIGADGGGGFLSLLTDQYEVDLYACAQCGKVELYTAQAALQKAQEQQQENLVVCPVCENKHSPLIGCPTCALRGIHSPRPSQSDPQKTKSTRKPPWEK